ncbi:capsular polysaccharide biosynthesis protein [Turicibacter faecis]|uniref:Capsular polysaccharide biosynthesis protein n=1 Tax=Turicibacter faecis TaxID=2963365 RepID=A0ABN6ZCM1_9FIRM|nr:chain-length determining protein [Turicibacter sp. TS3]BEH91607.1 capsular polysaccharide biosynthesis protein [Turicibacter sp. TC023]
MENTEYEIDLREIFGMLRKRWLMIASITLIAAILAAGVSFFLLKPQYEASTTMIVSYKQNQEALMDYNQLQMSQKLATTYSQIIKSNRIADKVIKKLDLDLSSKDLNSKISVSQVETTEIFKITVKDNDPELAALIANTEAEIFKQEINEMMKVDSVSTIDVAKVPESPVAPNKVMNIAIATVLGMMVSVGLVFVLEFLDRTYKTPSDIERHLGLPILGAIPDIKGL